MVLLAIKNSGRSLLRVCQSRLEGFEMNNQWKMVPADLLDRALLSIMEQGIEVDGQYELVEIQKAPVPPAGDVEVLPHGWVVGSRFYALREEAIEAAGKTAVIDVFTRSQITRLAAERDLLLARLEESNVDCEANRHEREVVCANYEVLQSELTKARELSGLSAEAFSVMQGMVEYCINARVRMGMDEGFKDFDTEEEHDFVKELRAFIAHQSAPAAKDEPRCNEERAELGLLTQPDCAACGRGSCFDR
jgi:hypothetical protein